MKRLILLFLISLTINANTRGETLEQFTQKLSEEKRSKLINLYHFIKKEEMALILKVFNRNEEFVNNQIQTRMNFDPGHIENDFGEFMSVNAPSVGVTGFFVLDTFFNKTGVRMSNGKVVQFNIGLSIASSLVYNIDRSLRGNISFNKFKSNREEEKLLDGDLYRVKKMSEEVSNSLIQVFSIVSNSEKNKLRIKIYEHILDEYRNAVLGGYTLFSTRDSDAKFLEVMIDNEIAKDNVNSYLALEKRYREMSIDIDLEHAYILDGKENRKILFDSIDGQISLTEDLIKRIESHTSLVDDPEIYKRIFTLKAILNKFERIAKDK